MKQVFAYETKISLFHVFMCKIAIMRNSRAFSFNIGKEKMKISDKYVIQHNFQ